MAFNIRKVFGRQSAGDSSATATQEPADDGGPTADPDQGAVSVPWQKAKSSQSKERQSQEGDPTGVAADGAPEGVVQYNESDLHFERTAGGAGADPQATGPVRLDPTPARLEGTGGDDGGIEGATINNSKSNNLRTAEADTGDLDGDVTLDEGPVAVLKAKTKSNQSNDRLGQEDDPAAVDLEGGGTLDEGPVAVLKNKTKSNQSNDRLGQEDNPAAVDGEGGGTLDEGPGSGLTSKTYDQKTNDRGDRLAQEEDGPDAGGGGIPSPVEAVNLNSSKSNIYRGSVGNDVAIDDAGGGGIPEPVETSNLNLSKSNINRVGNGGESPDPAAAGDPSDDGALGDGASDESAGRLQASVVGSADRVGVNNADGQEFNLTHEDDWETPTAREAASGMATGKAVGEKDHGSQSTVGSGREDQVAGVPPGEPVTASDVRAPGGAWQGENSTAGSDDGESQMADAARQKLWHASSFREQASDDDEGPSTLLDLSGSADGGEAGAMVDLDLDGLPDASDLDADVDADADGADLEELMADA